jgi:beta-glucosidase
MMTFRRQDAQIAAGPQPVWLAVVAIGLMGVIGMVCADNPPYRDSTLAVETRVADLLGRMTLDEKLAQLRCDGSEEVWGPALDTTGFGQIAPILRGYSSRESAQIANRIQERARSGRLGIPVIIHDEALHGLIAQGTTSFPQAIGLAATWNPDLMSRVATAIAKETRARGVRQVLSPVINVVRDARWGRVEETYGEDPLLTARMGVAFVKPFEDNGVITTPKHYAANVWDGGRDSHSVQISERSLREIYLLPFKAAFQEGGARSVMAAYNSLNGLPCSSNRWLLTEVLRNEWGFRGFVVSDYGSVGGILNAHHTAGSPEETAAEALSAGLEIEYPGVYIYGEPLKQAVEDGLVGMGAVDEAVKRVLRCKFEIGLFDDPFVSPDDAEAIVNCAEHRDLALEAARQAIVLLKDDSKTLPLSKDVSTVAVIGASAKGPMPLGGYSGNPGRAVSVLEGIAAKIGDDRVVYAKGCDISQTAALPAIPPSALIPASGKEGEHGLRGEYFANRNLEGEPALVRTDEKIDFDWGQGSPDPSLPQDNFSVRWSGFLVAEETGDYEISVTSDDGARLILDGKVITEYWGDRAAATDLATVHLEAGKRVPITLEYYEAGGYASVSLGWRKAGGVDRDIEEAVAAVRGAGAAIVVARINEGEGRDRAYLDLPGKQEQLIQAVAATGTPTVVVLIAGAPVTMLDWVDRVGAIVDAWYPGQEGGTAIADVLFGDYNPAGRLPITFPRTVGQVPLYYNLEPSGRGYDYVDSSGSPLFAFGHGLSYTEFAYSNRVIEPEKGGPDTEFTVSFDVENVGGRTSDEVAQLYIRDVVSSLVRPLMELKGFERVALQPGEKRTVRFTLGPDQLSFLDAEMKPVVEPGVFEVYVGASSDDIRLRGKLEVVR